LRCFLRANGRQHWIAILWFSLNHEQFSHNLHISAASQAAFLRRIDLMQLDPIAADSERECFRR
jgi:hypothetical protein